MAYIKSEELDNFISVALGLKFVVSGLHDYILECIKDAHQDIIRMSSTDLCSTNCSRKHGHSFSKWCDTCRFWKDSLYKLCRYKKQWEKINWKDIDTSDFPHATPSSYEAVTKLFVQDARAVSQGIFEDLGALLSLMRNMTVFSINRRTIEDVQRARNVYFGHNYRMTLHQSEKNHCLNILLNLLKAENIESTNSSRISRKVLEELRTTNGIPPSLLQRPEINNTLNIIRDDIKMIQSSLETSANSDRLFGQQDLEMHVDQIVETILENNRKSSKGNYKHIKPIYLKTLYYLLFLSIVCTCMFVLYALIRKRGGKRTIAEGCISMKFSQHWKSHLDFDFIVRDLNNNSIIERKWLADIVTHKLSDQETGLVITADMGFGKSSIISNLVCSERNSAWYSLKKQILAYHFCRYDVYDSASADVFIRNLAGAIVTQHPELGNAIINDDVASDFLYSTRCSKDPVSCLEEAILNPLQNQWKNQEYLIVIDALDECYTSGGRNSLLKLVYKQANKFPSNVKFLFTVRKIENIYRKLSDFEVLHLNGSDDNNMDDVRQYISQTLALSNPQIKKLASTASGNFLHVKLYLEYCTKTSDCDFTNIPASLEQQYQFNFERIFEKETELFDTLTPVFEVMCSTTRPLYLDELRKIAKLNKRKFRMFERLLGNELGHLLTFSDGVISFVHKSIKEFLTDPSRRYSKFFIHKKKGHRLFAKYILKNLNTANSVITDVVETVHHVAMSQNSDCEALLLCKLKDLNNYHQFHTKWLHQAVIHNSSHTINLFLKLTGLKNVDQTEDKRVSALFLAASLGHSETLQYLLDNGANPNFTVQFSSNDFSIDLPGKQFISTEIKLTMMHPDLDIIYVCKYQYFCGYNILQIASQNGHTHVVNILMRRYKYLAYAKNLMQLNAFQLAAEHGHYHIVKSFLESNKNFADLHSLHHASGNGHSRIVSILLQYDVKDQCIPCNGSIYWIPYFHNRGQQKIKMMSFSTLNETITLNTSLVDDWRFITCETALQAAIVSGHNGIVQTLLNQPYNALNCTTYDGMTPIMTAVKYNRTEIFKYLYSRGASLTSKCEHSFNISDVINLLSEVEFRNLTLNLCPSCASVLHIMAKYYFNHDLFLFIRSTGFNNWEVKDEQGATPLHYAFCNSNYIFIINAKTLGLNFTIRSSNGSTPYHSAAICKTFVLGAFSYAYRGHHIPDVLDKDRRSILHYAMLPFHQEGPKDDESGIKEFVSIFNVALKFSHYLYQTDKKGENILHYAAKSGNIYVFQFVKEAIREEQFQKLLKQRNKKRKMPLDTLFDSMPVLQTLETPLTTNPPPGCKQIEDTFSTFCNTNLRLFLSPHERCIYQVVTYLFIKDDFSTVNLTRLVLLSVLKKRVYPIIMLKMFSGEYLKRSISENENMISEIVIQSEGTDFFQYIFTRDNALQCNGSFSPLHKIIMNNRNTHWKSCNEDCLNKFVSKYNASDLDLCFDTDGNNLLHNAAMGGNIIAVKYLIQKGMNIFQLSLKGQKALEVSVLYSPHMVNGTLPSYYSKSSVLDHVDINTQDHGIKGFKDIKINLSLTYGTFVQYDDTATFLLQTIRKRYNVSMSTMDFCRKGEQRIGLVHIAAAKGLFSFLKTVKLFFGLEILNCRDSNNITPYYLSTLYNQTQIMRWMRNFPIDKVHPSSETENVLLYNVVSNYIVQTTFDWICKLQYNYRFSALIRLHIQKCLNVVKENKYAVVSRNVRPIREIAINTLHIILGSFALQIKYQRISTFCRRTFYKFCSTQISVDSLITSYKKEQSKRAYIILRIVVKFDYFDQMYVLQKLTKKHLGMKERAYSTLLSLNSIFSPRYLYLAKLRVRKDLHEERLINMKAMLQEPNDNVKFAPNKYLRNISSWIVKMGVDKHFGEKYKKVAQRGIFELNEHIKQIKQTHKVHT